MQRYKVNRQLYGYGLEACITKMEQDIHILLTGGCLPHTGAVSIFEDGKEAGSLQLPGHKDGLVGSRWARELSALFHCRVTVVCGIHYDNASSAMLQDIIGQTEDMLQEVIQNLK